MFYHKRIKGCFFLKNKSMNKSTSADEISFNVMKNCFEELSDILRYVFDFSLQIGIFPDPLKIAKVTLVFKAGDLKEISNYHPISVLPCFSKILECIMQNCLYNYLVNEKNYIWSSSASRKVIPQSMPLVNWLIKFMNHFKTTITHLGCSLIYPRPLILLTMHYY